ncbi:MAG: CHAT domain-containing tetratricopeptide repeat protein [Thermodesulfobacteriota bacterium]
MCRRVLICLSLWLIFCLGGQGWAAQEPEDAAPGQGTLTPAQKEVMAKAMDLTRQSIQMYKNRQPREGLKIAGQAQEMVEKALGPETPQAAAVFHRMAWAYDRAGYWNPALPLYQRALQIREKTLGPEHPATAATMARLARVYVILGYFRQGLPLAQRALKIREKVHGPEHQATAESLAILGYAYAQMGAHAKARPLCERALKLTEKTLGPEHPATALALDGLAVLFAQLGMYDQALPLAQRAVQINEKALGTDNRRTGRSLRDLGFIYLAKKDYGQAESCFRRAKGKMGDQGMVELYLATGRFPQALEVLSKLTPVSSVRPQYQAQYYTQEGLALKGMGRQEPAVEAFLKAVTAIEELRARTPGERASFFEAGVFIGYFRAYQGLVALLAQMALQQKPLPPSLQSYGPDLAAAALYFAESIKGRTLLEAMVAAPGRAVSPQIPAGLANREKRLQESFQELEAKREASFLPQWGHKRIVAEFQQRMESLRKEQQDLLTEIRRQAPRYAALHYPRPYKPQELPLKPGEVLLEYSLGDKESYLFKVEPGGRTQVFRLPQGQEALEKRLSALLAPFRQSALRREDLQKFSLAEAGALYQELLAPALAGVAPGTRLIIVPDGILGAFPFEALAVEKGPDWGKSVLVGDLWPVTYSQSAAILALNRHLGLSQAAQPLFALGDCIYDKNSPRYSAFKEHKEQAGKLRHKGPEKALTMATVGDRAGKLEFPPLPETRKTVEDLAELFGVAPQPPQVLLDMLATKSRLRQAPLDKYRYFFFGTHGFLADNLAGLQEPVLVLTQVETKSRDDGFLTFSEVMNFKMDAEVVTLAACMTGVGRIMQGEGVLNFARAFQQAGARSVTVALWNIPVEESLKFYRTFYQALKDGKSKLEALKMARQAVRAKEPHPYFWSGLILHGEG